MPLPSFPCEPALPLIMQSLTSACCVSVWGWRVVPDIFCQSSAAPLITPPPPPSPGLRPNPVTGVCVLCRHPRGLNLTLFLLRGWAFSEIVWHSDDLLQIWIFTVDLIFNIVTRAEIWADLWGVPNWDTWELCESYWPFWFWTNLSRVYCVT